ncbi:restriction endonuclease subunit S [Shewanella litoralis]|uniref:restriction endonuclease subunit S n=1 Tax=Shewanella litoralis TaxID=2282700 RepID=UPI001F0F5FB6|nr:restriction endonuclease subunit S [Shewanella litoralis]
MPQHPNDEPASVLLERIVAEKAQLVKEGKLKKQKPLPEVGEDEKPFELSQGWEWSRLSQTGLGSTGKTPSTKQPIFFEGNIPFIGPGQITPAGIILKSDKFLSESGLGHSSEALPDDIFMVCIGGSIGKAAIVVERSGFNQQINCISPIYIISTYLYFALSTYSFYSSVLEKATGSATPIINRGKWEELLVPIPPLEEQHRIVAKVDELMLLCDALEAQTEASIVAHQTLVETLLNALLLPNTTQQTTTNTSNTLADSLEPAFDNSDASSPEPSLTNSFEKAWLRIAEHFDTLFTTAASIDTLKQTILQLAVMGKLVPQNVNDEPAAKLLERIAAEKAQLIKDGKIKKQKPLVDFEGLGEMKKPLPNSWEWIRLADTADLVRGGSPRPAGDPRFYGGDIPFLKVGDITRKSSKFVEGFNSSITEAGLHKTRLIETRTVLLSNSGATLGIPAICTFPATFNDGVAAFVERSQFIFDEYLYLYLSTLSKWFLDIASRGQGQPNLNTDIIKATWFALPPLEEQYRIVAKVDELMALCDQLKARLSDAQTTQLHLTDAIVEQAL